MKNTAETSISTLFATLAVWRRAGERAPHKPLLLLLALGLFSRGIHRLPFSEYEPRLVELLREFGPSRRTLHPEYPFLRLAADRVWEIVREGEGREGENTIAGLRATGAAGRFPDQIQSAFASDPRLINKVATQLLTAHFPESLHQDILDAVGLSLATVPAAGRQRDPNFRSAVLVAYQYRCNSPTDPVLAYRRAAQQYLT